MFILLTFIIFSYIQYLAVMFVSGNLSNQLFSTQSHQIMEYMYKVSSGILLDFNLTCAKVFYTYDILVLKAVIKFGSIRIF